MCIIAVLYEYTNEWNEIHTVPYMQKESTIYMFSNVARREYRILRVLSICKVFAIPGTPRMSGVSSNESR